MREDRIPKFVITRRCGNTTIHRASDMLYENLEKEDLVASVCNDVADFLSSVNTTMYDVGVKFFWSSINRPGSQILAHVRLSATSTKCRKTLYHIWTINLFSPKEKSTETIPNQKGASDNDTESTSVSCES